MIDLFITALLVIVIIIQHLTICSQRKYINFLNSKLDWWYEFSKGVMADWKKSSEVNNQLFDEQSKILDQVLEAWRKQRAQNEDPADWWKKGKKPE